MLDPRLDPKHLGHPVPPFETERGKKWIQWNEKEQRWEFEIMGDGNLWQLLSDAEISGRNCDEWLKCDEWDRNDQIVMMMIGILHEEVVRLAKTIHLTPTLVAREKALTEHRGAARSLYEWGAYARGEWEA